MHTIENSLLEERLNEWIENGAKKQIGYLYSKNTNDNKSTLGVAGIIGGVVNFTNLEEKFKTSLKN